jgi:hypothetical protein
MEFTNPSTISLVVAVFAVFSNERWIPLYLNQPVMFVYPESGRS